MLAVFCLRLACGMTAVLPLLSPGQVHPRFFRVQYLAALGLAAVAAFAVRDVADRWLWAALAVALALTLAGALAWSLPGAVGTAALSALTTAALAAAVLALPGRYGPTAVGWRVADHLTSAALLGASTAAMLMGHSYLIAPAMSLTPLMRLLAALVLALVARAAVAGCGFWDWAAAHPSVSLEEETALWLAVRWGVGLLIPLVLAWMAWQSARIRSTQSATGILYVVVIVCYLGELTSQLLAADTGFVL